MLKLRDIFDLMDRVCRNSESSSGWNSGVEYFNIFKIPSLTGLQVKCDESNFTTSFFRNSRFIVSVIIIVVISVISLFVTL
jgi:hypothetical protein